MKAGVIIVSDRCFKGEREDGTGPVIADFLKEESIVVENRTIVPDDPDVIKRTIENMVDVLGLDLVILAGGTGIGPRDVTPEAVVEIIDKCLPGFGEAMRMKSFEATPRSILSRSGAGTRGGSLIIYLPGSPRAARECLGYVMGAVGHAVEVLGSGATDCGSPLDSSGDHR